MEEREYDVAVIGAGPGGATAALYCARAGYRVAIVEKLAPGGQMATTEIVDNYPGFDAGVGGAELGERMLRGAERFGVRTFYEEMRGLRADGDTKIVVTDAGTLRVRAVVAAVGARPRELGLPEEKGLIGRGVAYCAACDGMRYAGREVAVIGGGDSAATDALTLAKICRKVTMIHRRDALRASRFYARALAAAGVEIVFHTRVARILHQNRVTGLELEDTAAGTRKKLACEGVFVAIGRIPATEPFRGVVELDAQGYLIADESTRTSAPDVFAVGDARTKAMRQIVTAAADGAVASREVEAYLG